MDKILILAILLINFVIPSNAQRVEVGANELSHKESNYTPQLKSTNDLQIENRDDAISSLTLAVNTVNNVLTWASFIVALLTLFTILLGLVGYYRLKKSIDKKIKEADLKLLDLKTKEEQLSETRTRIDEFNNLLQEQKIFVNSTNQYLYKATEQVINEISDQQVAMEIFEGMVHDYHVANLYAPDENTRFAAIAYLNSKGVPKDINALEGIANSETNEQYRIMAREAVGVIKHKYPDDENTNN